MNKQLVSTSKFLSLLLRHQPDVIGLQLDDQGWLDINALIENANARGNPIMAAASAFPIVRKSRPRENSLANFPDAPRPEIAPTRCIP